MRSIPASARPARSVLSLISTRASHPGRRLNPRGRSDDIETRSSAQLWLRPFAEAAAHPWTLFDLRDLRAQLPSANFSYELREIIAGYDAVVVLENSRPARFENGR
jgi:hypothetical protein